MSTAASPLTIDHEERARRLEAATAIRMARADLRRRLAAMPGTTSLRVAAVMVSHPRPWAETWNLFGFLLAVRGIGPRAAYKALEEAGISERRTIGTLTPRQRQAVCAWLEQTARRRAGQSAAPPG